MQFMGFLAAQVRQLVLTAMEQCATAAAQSYHAVAGDAGIIAGTTGGFSLAVPHHVEVLGQKLIQAAADVCIKASGGNKPYDLVLCSPVFISVDIHKESIS
jgi:hypothetical protein